MNLSQLPPQKKRVLAIGLVAFVVLLFISFLLSLLEEDTSTSPESEVLVETKDGLQLKTPQVPSAQRYDFNQEPQSGGLEDLLTGDQEVGMDKNPFANMQGQGTNPPVYGPEPLKNVAEEEGVSGVEELSMPSAEAQGQYILYCDMFDSAQEAESQKAMLAFQGVSASVVESDGKYRLKIGPYATNESAKATFNDLGLKGLVKKCSLISN